MSSTTNTVTFVAPDISCGHCVATVKNAVGALPGVTNVEADLATKRVEIAFDPNLVSLDQIVVVLDETGYPVTK